MSLMGIIFLQMIEAYLKCGSSSTLNNDLVKKFSLWDISSDVQMIELPIINLGECFYW